ATLRVAAGSVAPRAHAGGVSGIALQSHRPRSALLRSADFGEPECSAGASWTCALASVALSQRLPRSAHLTTSASLTSELSGGGSIARGEAMLNGGVHRVRSVTLQPGTALQLGPSPGASAWSRIEHANGGIYLRISQGRMLRPALRVVGADDARVLAPEFLQRWERIAARQGSLDARWTPADWLRAGAGFRVWHERSLGITGRGRWILMRCWIQWRRWTPRAPTASSLPVRPGVITPPHRLPSSTATGRARRQSRSGGTKRSSRRRVRSSGRRR